MQLRHDGVEIGALAVDVVDEDAARKTHVLGFPPELRRHDLRAFHGVDDEHRHFGRLHGGQRIADKVGVAGRVKQVDLVIVIRDGRDGGAHGEAPPDFLFVVIEVGLAVVRRAHARGSARNVKHRLGERRFARAILADEHDIANMFCCRSCHEDHHFRCRGGRASPRSQSATEPHLVRKAPAVA